MLANQKITVKQARQLSGKTQKEIAEILGVHPHTYMKWEHDPEEMSVSTAKQFCRIVNKPFNEIFFEGESNLIGQGGESDAEPYSSAIHTHSP